MKMVGKMTGLAAIGMVVGCTVQKIQRLKAERLARRAAGESPYERRHPGMWKQPHGQAG
ncbi:hypothetical protein Hsar01_01762 [Haloferula sargassicola]|uniref:Lipoprotein n=1 Tax=Haloferula sargassicola TaxID=490096 RepID=A0ABP9UT63_9BACT